MLLIEPLYVVSIVVLVLLVGFLTFPLWSWFVAGFANLAKKLYSIGMRNLFPSSYETKEKK